ncbi:MAG TPA: protein phosphatase 2C domain-containing protein, partial [Ktedonobacterales bacterium]|nr:protein phosphatase 2C domain-containing protein [Ktedonobacterales bacterium]
MKQPLRIQRRSLLSGILALSLALGALFALASAAGAAGPSVSGAHGALPQASKTATRTPTHTATATPTPSPTPTEPVIGGTFGSPTATAVPPNKNPETTTGSTPGSNNNSFFPASLLGIPTTFIALGVLAILVILVFVMTFLLQVRARRRREIQQPAAATAFPPRTKASGQLSPSYAGSAAAGATAPFETLPAAAPVRRTIVCPRCGMQNNPGSSTCANCGLDLPQGVAGTSGAGRGLGRSISGGPAPLTLPPLNPPPAPAPDIAEMPTHIFQLPNSDKAEREATLPTVPSIPRGKQEEATVVMRGRTRPPLGVKVSAKTDPGRRRKDNEDNYLAVTGTWRHNGQLQPFGLFVIADGMGGHANGQDASRMAVETIYQHLAEAMPSQDTPDDALGSLLQESIQRANQMIYQQNQKDHADMGCTMTAALVTGSEAHICNVGDSRTYLLNPNDHLQRVTTDHSIVQSLV